MSPSIVGRDDERAVVCAFLEAPSAARPALLEIAGPAGIGKSVLWNAGLEHALTLEYRILVARPAEAEQTLGHAALGDVFDEVLDEVLPVLPAPRRAAMEIALARQGTPGQTVDARVLGAAVRSALEHLSRNGGVLVAIDDLQWMDAASADALWFAIRRMDAGSVRVMATRRTETRLDASPLDVVGEVQRLDVGPLSTGALQTAVHQRLGAALPRRVLLRLDEISGGNPLFALSLAAAWGADPDPSSELPVPAKLEDLVRGRLHALSDRVRQALALVAVVGKAGDRFAARAGIVADLDDAIAAGILHRTGNVFSFAQPLVASVLLGDLAASSRRDVHALAATLTEDGIEATRHRALAADAPDDAIAAELDDAVGVARERGAAVFAAELAQLALRLTPPNDAAAARRRSIAAIRSLDAAGDRPTARSMADTVLDSSAAGIERAEALVLVHELEPLDRSLELLEEALAEAGGHAQMQAVIHRQLAEQGRLIMGQAWAKAHAREALALARTIGDDALTAGCLSVLGLLLFRGGDAEGQELVEQAVALARRAADPVQVRLASAVAGHVFLWSGQIEAARDLFEEEREMWQDRDEPWTANVLWYLSLVEVQAGRWDRADAYARDSLDLEEQYGLATPMAYFPAALVAAHLGDEARALEVAQRGIALADEQGVQLPGLVSVPGVVDSWGGRAASAADTLAAASRMADDVGLREPGMLPWRAEEIESLLELGRLDDAAALLASWKQAAERLGRVWVLAAAGRCEGLLLAARGDVTGAVEVLEEAVAGHERAGDPFGRARTLLALGTVKRKARMKAPARRDMEAALAAFRDLGAAGWEVRAAGEIKRIGGRTRRDELSQVERRVAELAGSGKTNREIAAALFLSERTVASHLTRIYAKTGVRSRTELASKLQTF